MGITLDAVSSAASTGSSSLTYAATVNTGNNRLLAVSNPCRDVGASNPSSITWNSIGLQVAIQRLDGNGLYSGVWYLEAAAVGNFNVVVNTSGASWISSIAISMFGVEQDSITRVNDTDSGTVSGANVISLSGLTTTVAGCAVVDSVASNQPITAMTAITNRVERMRIDPAGAGDGAGASTIITQTAAGSPNMEWDIEDGTNACLSAAAFAPAASGWGPLLGLQNNRIVVTQ